MEVQRDFNYWSNLHGPSQAQIIHHTNQPFREICVVEARTKSVIPRELVVEIPISLQE